MAAILITALLVGVGVIVSTILVVVVDLMADFDQLT